MTTPPPRHGQGGPPLPLLAVLSAALFVAGLITGALLSGQGYPSIYAATGDRLGYLTTQPQALQWTGMLHFSSAVPLAILAASLHARLHRLGVRAPGAGIALTGGIIAATALMLSGLLQWVTSRHGQADATALVLHDLIFLTGGPGHVVPLGLLVAGVAVPGLLLKLLPRPVAVAGLLIAVIAELTTLTLLITEAAYLLPVRFAALAWLIVAAIQLPADRRQISSAPAATATPGAAPTSQEIP
ncbi:hypothetical protein ACFFMN_43220 [Planobispora siamensis]|uniref:DUF4386 domain-containing protein n=1 Tax=Planobispora siamensis TaxID=936338 RepID=A0A8J3SRQ0_9ACTN|nr:hypothetical protein [Planobispora siamensis]GIH97641.1 hypothetical protein Psi01_82710 [Planobispora siamensis]